MIKYGLGENLPFPGRTLADRFNKSKLAFKLEVGTAPNEPKYKLFVISTPSPLEAPDITVEFSSTFATLQQIHEFLQLNVSNIRQSPYSSQVSFDHVGLFVVETRIQDDVFYLILTKTVPPFPNAPVDAGITTEASLAFHKSAKTNVIEVFIRMAQLIAGLINSLPPVTIITEV